MTAIILRRRKLGRTSCREIAAASTTGIKVVRNWRALDWRAARGTDGLLTVFRWGCTSLLDGVTVDLTVVNTAASVSWCSQKKQGRLDMQAAGVPVPETWDSETFEELLESGQLNGGDQLYVSRPGTHAQGRNLACNVAGDLLLWAGGYVSVLVNKVAEYRVFVCQNRAVWVAKKTPGNPDQVAWNVAQGGRFDNVRWGEWNMDVVDAALQAARVSGTDFCGVDVMVDADGMPYVLEVNSAPSQTSPYRQQCVAKAFDYIVRNGKQHFPDVEAESWRDVIHPALRGEDA